MNNKRSSDLQDDAGFAVDYSKHPRRLINKDGTFNVNKVDYDVHYKNVYQFLILTSWEKFFALIILFFLLLNIFFAVVYVILGAKSINITGDVTIFQLFVSSFFFSVQTFTTVGYGGMMPDGVVANVIASVEAFIGLVAFALATGLFYGRFAKPSARILFSKNGLIVPHKDGFSFQFRIANLRKNILMEVEAQVLLSGLIHQKNDSYHRWYHQLELETSTINFFPLNWTIVHPITKGSPLFRKSIDELKNMDLEILILIKGFDDTFSQTVHARHSYLLDEIVWNARFTKPYYTDETGMTQFDIHKIHEFETVASHEFNAGT